MTVESLADQPVGHLVVGYGPGPNLATEEIMYGMMHTFFFSFPLKKWTFFES